MATEPVQFRGRLLMILPAALLLVLNIFVFGPAAVFRGNPAEFSAGFWTIEAIYLYPAAIIFVALAGIGLVLPRRFFHGYSAVLFGFGVLAWVQGNILLWDYGVFDGTGINWGDYSWRGLVDAGVWAGLLLIIFLFRKKAVRISAAASLTLIAIQGVVFISSYSSLKPAQASRQIELPKGLLEYSSSFNIVHILLDAFQTDVFEEIVKEKKMAPALEGFVLFRENMAAYSATNFSLPSIFSGEAYQGDIEPSSFMNRIYSEKAFFKRLLDSGYTVNLVPGIIIPAKNFSNLYRVPRIYGGTMRDNEVSEAASLMDVALFRLSPQFLKKKIYDSENWTIRRAFAENSRSEAGPKAGTYIHLEFFRDYRGKIRVAGPEPAYHFIHLLSPHPPNTAHANCDYAGGVLPNDKNSYMGEASCVLALVADFLGELRKLGLYDSSFIILQADHGGGYPPINAEGEPGKEISPQWVGRSLALLAVKPSQAKGDMRVSSAKTILTDIPSTVMKAAGLPDYYEGHSVFELDPDGARERHFFIPEDISKRAVINRLKVVGSVYDYGSWLREKDITSAFSASLYKWGTQIGFGTLGKALPYLDKGWARPLNSANWTKGKRASLSMPISEPESTTITMKTRFDALVHPGIIDGQTVNVIVNGKKVASWYVQERGFRDYSATFPKNLVSGKKNLEIAFDLPDAVPANAVPGEASSDLRGIAVGNITLIDGPE